MRHGGTSEDGRDGAEDRHDTGAPLPPGPDGADALLVAALHVRSLPCPVCGHDLHRAAAARCPECGARIELRLHAPLARGGSWIAGIVVLALPLGFGGLLATLMVLASFDARMGSDERRMAIAGAFVAAVSGAALAFHLRGRAVLVAASHGAVRHVVLGAECLLAAAAVTILLRALE